MMSISDTTIIRKQAYSCARLLAAKHHRTDVCDSISVSKGCVVVVKKVGALFRAFMDTNEFYTILGGKF